MRNMKALVYQKLCDQFGADRVTDQYPTNWAVLPAIQYTEEENNVYERTGEGETQSYVRYRVDIWDNVSTSQSMLQVEDALGIPLGTFTGDSTTGSLGLSRTMCQDVSDPSGLKHKVMRFEGIVDNENDAIYWK